VDGRNKILFDNEMASPRVIARESLSEDNS
jgi:hypothetical protein